MVETFLMVYLVVMATLLYNSYSGEITGLADVVFEGKENVPRKLLYILSAVLWPLWLPPAILSGKIKL